MAVSDYQASFGGLVVGAGTPWLFAAIDGLETFESRTTDVVSPVLWGTLPGTDFVDERTVTITFRVVGGAAVRQQLENAFLPGGSTLSTFVYKLPNREELQMLARCRRRARPIAVDTEYGIVDITVELGMPDPRRYSTTLYQGSASPFITTGGGFELATGSGVNLGFDLTAGAGVNLGFDMSAVVGGGSTFAVNSGNVDTYPTVTFTAPGGMTQWKLSNLTTGESMSFAMTLNPGEQLIADISAIATGKTGLPISLAGVSRYASWQAPRIPVRLSPGSNLMRFDVQAGVATGAIAAISWRNAYL